MRDEQKSRMLATSCWLGTLLLKLLAMVAAGSNAEAESQFNSSTFCNLSSTSYLAIEVPGFLRITFTQSA